MDHEFFVAPKGNDYIIIIYIKFIEFLCVGHFNLKINNMHA